MPYYANSNFNEPAQTLLIMTALYIAWKFDSLLVYFISGFLLAYSVAIRIDTLPVVLVIYLSIFFKLLIKKNIKKLLTFSSNFIFIFSLLILYYYSITGNYFVFRAPGDNGLKPVYLFTGLKMLLFDSRYGYFFYQPLFIITLINSILILLRKPSQDKNFTFFIFLTLIIFSVNVLFLSLIQNYNGGWNWGPRLLYKSVPFFIITQILITPYLSKKNIIISFLFASVSLLINITGLIFGVNGLFTLCIKNSLIEYYYDFYLPLISPLKGNFLFFLSLINSKKNYFVDINSDIYLRIEPIIFHNHFLLFTFITFIFIIIFYLFYKIIKRTNSLFDFINFRHMTENNKLLL